MKRLLKLTFIGCASIVGVLTIAVVVLIVMNGRDPYGGPIEPSSDH